MTAELWSQTLITGGLTADIVGFLLVYFFLLPLKVSRGGAINLILEQNDPEEAETAERYRIFGVIGGILVLLGFVLQIAGVWI